VKVEVVLVLNQT